MNRRAFIRSGVVAGAAVLAGCSGGEAGPAFEEGFEGGFPDRTAGAAIGPEVALPDFEREFGVSEIEAATGDRSLRIWNEGDYDDGVTWGVHPVSVDAGGA